MFYVAVGADGAPFGKDDTVTAYLVSFIMHGRVHVNLMYIDFSTAYHQK